MGKIKDRVETIKEPLNISGQHFMTGFNVAKDGLNDLGNTGGAPIEEIANLYNDMPCGFHSVNREGIFVFINDAELSWLGYQRDELIRNTVLIGVV